MARRSSAGERPKASEECEAKGSVENGKSGVDLERNEDDKPVDQLERELERELLNMLREQNSKLLQQVQQLSRGKGTSSTTGSSWEEVGKEVCNAGATDVSGKGKDDLN